MASNGEENSSSRYFSSYSDLSVHSLMLRDQPRTNAYKEFIEKNKFLFENKVVLDVGAGTGILSLFCASAGASCVFAVEASDIADTCSKVVECNNLQDKVKVIKGRIEDIELPVSKVDVIVSEWMGFYLLHESMLDSVIFARDKWLSDGGAMVPSHATLYLTPVNMSKYVTENFRFWDNVYGYNFTPMQQAVMSGTLGQPVIDSLIPDQCVSDPEIVEEFNLMTTKTEDVTDIKKKFTFTIKKPGLVHGFAVWFDIYFSSPAMNQQITNERHRVHFVTLSTSPMAPQTHWKQTVIFLPISPSVDEEETLSCELQLIQDEGNKRLYNISIEMLDEDNSSDESSDSSEEDVSGHPMPCDCGAGKCTLIKAIMEKYDEEQAALEDEADLVDISAGREAARSVDREEQENGEHLNGFDSC